MFLTMIHCYTISNPLKEKLWLCNLLFEGKRWMKFLLIKSCSSTQFSKVCSCTGWLVECEFQIVKTEAPDIRNESEIYLGRVGDTTLLQKRKHLCLRFRFAPYLFDHLLTRAGWLHAVSTKQNECIFQKAKYKFVICKLYKSFHFKWEVFFLSRKTFR